MRAGPVTPKNGECPAGRRLCTVQVAFLPALAGGAPSGNWPQWVGAAYDRSLRGFCLKTAPEDDDRLIEFLNVRPSQRRFHLPFRNGADFARSIINSYYRGAIGPSIIADFGIMTPKQAAPRSD